MPSTVSIAQVLPPEILHAIFILLPSQARSVPRRTKKFPVWLSVYHVCSRWRVVAKSCKALWTYIPIEHGPMTSVALALAQPNGVHVDVSSSIKDLHSVFSEGHDVWYRLQTSSCTVRRLTLMKTTALVHLQEVLSSAIHKSPFFPWFYASTFSFEQLELSSSGGSEAFALLAMIATDVASRRNLRVLRLRHLPRPALPMVIFSPVTALSMDHLELDGVLCNIGNTDTQDLDPHFPAVISNYQASLRHLIISNTLVRHQDVGPLPLLEIVHIRGSHRDVQLLMLSLQAPNCRDLSVCLTDAESSESRIPDVASFLQLDIHRELTDHPIRHLCIRSTARNPKIWADANEFVRFISHFPHLRSFTTTLPAIQMDLDVDDGHALPVSLPELTHLKLDGYVKTVAGIASRLLRVPLAARRSFCIPSHGNLSGQISEYSISDAFGIRTLFRDDFPEDAAYTSFHILPPAQEGSTPEIDLRFILCNEHETERSARYPLPLSFDLTAILRGTISTIGSFTHAVFHGLFSQGYLMQVTDLHISHSHFRESYPWKQFILLLIETPIASVHIRDDAAIVRSFVEALCWIRREENQPAWMKTSQEIPLPFLRQIVMRDIEFLEDALDAPSSLPFKTRDVRIKLVNCQVPGKVLAKMRSAFGEDNIERYEALYEPPVHGGDYPWADPYDATGTRSGVFFRGCDCGDHQ
ncbi:hypothetical protein K488DRAFT_85198 [Vararia minispora EC-137]|uniref:Uncharacterized protein n=1 Tax=Vararia minispora EC-137 TaxID=1314806 RepID=A0ACB8QN61_9AGAM|nr:hypothetical protein K488DRAFT_85198 [Vararia minispora EC-137]